MRSVPASVASLLLAAGLSRPALAQAPGQNSPMEVTTDTPEYCLQLFDKVHTLEHYAKIKPPQEVCDLTGQGHRMCAHGQTRRGILRLRRAILLMMQEEPAPER